MSDSQTIIAELPRLRRYARALVRDADAADDLVQDCVERALSRIDQFRTGTNMRAWLLTIMHGIYVNGVRRRHPSPESLALHRELTEGSDGVPEQERGLIVIDLEEALAGLPDDQREIVLLIGLEDMSYKQAAETVGIPIGTVMSRLARGRERLRTLMGEEDVVLLRKAR